MIDALDELLRERSFEAIHLTDIAGRAGNSVATVHQRFSNKDAAVAIRWRLQHCPLWPPTTTPTRWPPAGVLARRPHRLWRELRQVPRPGGRAVLLLPAGTRTGLSAGSRVLDRRPVSLFGTRAEIVVLAG